MSSLIGVECWCDFGAILAQCFIGRYSRYSRYRTKSHDKATISHHINDIHDTNGIAKTRRDNKKRHPRVICVASIVYRWAPLFVIPPRTEADKSTALVSRAKKVHRTVFLTPSQFTRDNHKSTPLECFLLSPEACPRISSERSEDFIQEMLGFHHYR